MEEDKPIEPSALLGLIMFLFAVLFGGLLGSLATVVALHVWR